MNHQLLPINKVKLVANGSFKSLSDLARSCLKREVSEKWELK